MWGVKWSKGVAGDELNNIEFASLAVSAVEFVLEFMSIFSSELTESPDSEVKFRKSIPLKLPSSVSDTSSYSSQRPFEKYEFAASLQACASLS